MRKTIGKLIGRIGTRYYVCDGLFDSDNFKGATGIVLRPVSQTEYELMNDPDSNEVRDRFEELWIKAVKTGQTQDGLTEYCRTLIWTYGDEALWDYSGYEYWDMIREVVPELNETDYPCFDCVGGGRSFWVNMEWDELYDSQTWALIQEYESE